MLKYQQNSGIAFHNKGKYATFAALPALLAQLVQSTALTGRGSLVRVQYNAHG